MLTPARLFNRVKGRGIKSSCSPPPSASPVKGGGKFKGAGAVSADGWPTPLHQETPPLKPPEWSDELE